MTNENNSDPKAKYREALEKKKNSNSPQSKGASGSLKSEEGNPEQVLLKCFDGNLDQVKN